MDYRKAMQLLKGEKLLGLAEKNKPVFAKVLKKCLDAKDEKIVIVGDAGLKNKRIAPILSMSYFLAAKELGFDVRMELSDNAAERVSKQITEKISAIGDRNIVIINSSNKFNTLKWLSKSFRHYAKEHNHKFLSTSSLGFLTTDHISDFISAIDVDYDEMHKVGLKLKKLMDKAKEIRVTTPAGTDIIFEVKGKKSILADGVYPEFGTGGNMPGGEVYMPPRKKAVEGVIVVDGSIRTIKSTMIPKIPVKLIVEDGRVEGIEGGKEADLLRQSFEKVEAMSKFPWGVRRIGELGIGINKGAKLVGSTILDEKCYNTCHMAAGSNYWFGGTIYAKSHLDQVMKDPSFYFDGEKVDMSRTARQ